MSKRPNVFDFDSIIVKKPAPVAPAPAVDVVAATPVQEPVIEKPERPKAAALAPAPVRKPAPPPPPSMFRTSVYFSRAVHDKLRDIAHEERKSITDLINEGLDHVLTARNYPPTTELREKAK